MAEDGSKDRSFAAGSSTSEDLAERLASLLGQPSATPPTNVVSADTSILIRELLGFDRVAEASPNLRITSIDQFTIAQLEAIALPGIRVGEGEGAGFVFHRTRDGELIFSPDENFDGTTSFACGVTDANGAEASLRASVRVMKPQPFEIAFSDGSVTRSITEGTSAAIIGTVAIPGVSLASLPLFQVFEGESRIPSQRFTIAGDTLKSNEPLDHLADGIVQLRVVVDAGDNEIATGDLRVQVLQADQETRLQRSDAAGIWPTLVYDADALSTSIQHLIAGDLLPQGDTADGPDIGLPEATALPPLNQELHDSGPVLEPPLPLPDTGSAEPTAPPVTDI